MPIKRLDREGRGGNRPQFEKNKRKIYATQDICGICGKPVDKTIKYPDPMSKCIDHIIPIARGGHPSDISNLQLAHMCCNRDKSDKIRPNTNPQTQGIGGGGVAGNEIIDNRVLPQSLNWADYKG